MNPNFGLVPVSSYWRHILESRLMTPAKKAAVFLLSRMDVTAWATLKTGQHLKVDLSSSVGRSIWYRGSYESTVEAQISRTLQQGDAFIDIGANVGYFSIVAATLVGEEGEVHGFEPNQRVCHLFEQSISANSLRNIRAVPAALWGEPTTLGLTGQHNSGFAHVYLHRSEQAVGKARRVEATTLDTYARSFVHRPIKLVKIDVEGAEIHVLHGMRQILQKYRPFLIVEAQDWSLSRFGHRLEDMFALLEKYGYSACDLEGHETRSATEARELLESQSVKNLLFTGEASRVSKAGKARNGPSCQDSVDSTA
jgi:FkbM family methyltransferase